MNEIISVKFVEHLIDIRDQMRKACDYAGADIIRDALARYGIVLEDTKDGTTFKICVIMPNN